MGYDVCLCVERKSKDGEWEAQKVNGEFTIGECGAKTLFAILADIKNYHGIKPLGSNKGIPKDISKIVRYELYKHNCSEGFSYYTLKELKEYDWNQIVNIEKYVSLNSYKEWMSRRKTGEPESYCTGTNAEIISNEEMEKIISENPSVESDHSPSTKATWDKTYAEASYPLYEKVIPELQKLSEGYGDENVRIVFGFNW